MSINAHSVPPYISGSIKNRRPLIMADVFRPFPNSNNARRGMQNDIAQRLFRWVTPALRQVFSREPELAIWDDAIENAFPTRAVYEMENLDPSTVGWGKIYQRSATRGVVEFLSERFESSFVVGFELCPYQKDILNRLGTPYLSLAIHPLRFLNDYAFMIESNFVKHKHMRMFALDAADIKTAAHMRAASHASELDDKLVPNSAILFGQVDIDAALINGRGGFDGLFDFQNELAQLSSEHETVYFKPHPYQGSAEAQLTFLKQYNNVEFLDVNPYKLLSHPNISTVSALTSSILSEALIFDKKIKPLSPNWIDRSAEPAYGVSILSLKFWHYLVSQRHRSYRRLAECLKSHAGRRSNLYPGLQLSDVTLKSLLNVSWERSSPSRVISNYSRIPFGKTICLGESDGRAICQGGAWYNPSLDHRWMRSGRAHLDFNLPQNSRTDYEISLSVRAMASKQKPITLRVYGKSSILFEHTFKDSAVVKLSFVLPQAVSSTMGSVRLDLECKEANSPREISGSPDDRAMSIAVYSMEVSPVTPSLVLALGEKVFVSKMDTPSLLLRDGWYSPEPIGVWTRGKRSSISISSVDLPDEDFLLTLGGVRVFFTEHLVNNTATFRVGGEICASFRFSRSQPQIEELTVPLPRRFFQSNERTVIIELELEYCDSPYRAKMSEDKRELGILFDSVELETEIRALARRPNVHAVNIFGPFNIHTGLGVMARNTYSAINSAIDEMVSVTGLKPPRAINFNNSLHMDEDTRFVGANLQGSDLNLFIGDVTRIQRMVRRNGSGFLCNRYNIVYGAWELERLPTYLADTNYIDEYWALSNFIAEAARSRIDVPVSAFPLPVSLHYPEKLLSRLHFKIPNKSFTFLFTFSVDSTMSRKNPEAVVNAFRLAFPDVKTPVSLVIKSMIRQASAENRMAFDAFKKSASEDPRIIILEETYSRDELASLYLNCDAYISLHRAEGFGLTMAEAMGYGKPTIGTAYSGNLDFMNETNSCLVRYRKVEMLADAYHNQLQYWAEPDILDAAQYMARVFEDIKFRETIARAGKRTILEHFSPYAVGRSMLNRLHKIREGM